MEINKNELGYVLINLMPYRNKIKAEKLRRFWMINGLFVVVAIAILSLVYSYISLEIDSQSKRNSFIEKENTELVKQIKEIADLKTSIKETLEKRGVVESLQVDRSDAVNILNFLTNLLPSGTNIESLKQENENITLVGLTQSNNKVSEYIIELEKTNFFSNIILVEIKSVKIQNDKVNNSQKDTGESIYNEFTLILKLNKKVHDSDKESK